MDSYIKVCITVMNIFVSNQQRHIECHIKHLYKLTGSPVLINLY